MVERYNKITKIGCGTFGEAWLVNSVCSGRSYVIKEVHLKDLTEDDLVKTQREATVLARCKHINIIRYKESFLRNDPFMMCLVMEYADGGDLFEKEKEAMNLGILIPEQTVMHWFIQVVFAVHYLHSNNILHRDLKTQNIFLTRFGIVKVGDFGIARFLRTKQELATTAIGTPYYLSPEICQSKPYNHRSDMWALGCILYELCALKHPFEADDFQGLVLKILVGFFKPVHRQYSRLVQDLIAVLLRTNPETRPTADQLLMIPKMKPLVEDYIQRHQNFISKCDNSVNNRSPSCSSDGGVTSLSEESTSSSNSSSSGVSSASGTDKSFDSKNPAKPSLAFECQDERRGNTDVGPITSTLQSPKPNQRERRDSETQTPPSWSSGRRNSFRERRNDQEKHEVGSSESCSKEPRQLYPFNLPNYHNLQAASHSNQPAVKNYPEDVNCSDQVFSPPRIVRSNRRRSAEECSKGPASPAERFFSPIRSPKGNERPRNEFSPYNNSPIRKRDKRVDIVSSSQDECNPIRQFLLQISPQLYQPRQYMDAKNDVSERGSVMNKENCYPNSHSEFGKTFTVLPTLNDII